jgi:hypothetical protein
MSEDDLYARIMGLYVKYLESILELLSRPIPQQSSILLESFWSFSNWRGNYQHTSIHTSVGVDLEYRVIFPYCGLEACDLL